MKYEKFRVEEDKKLNFKKYDTNFTGDYKDKAEAIVDLQKNIARLAEMYGVDAALVERAFAPLRR